MFKNIQLYRDPRVMTILFLGFSSGLPFLLTLATLQVWLAEVGVSKTTIGLFSLYTLPYALKVIWAPILDSIPFPFLSAYLGHRKGWILGSQIFLMISLVSLGLTNPAISIFWTALATFFVAFFSATQDIVYEAYRVETLPHSLQGPAAGASSFGYRVGMLVSGAGALYLASVYSWFIVYSIMSFLMVVGAVTIFLSPPEKEHEDSIKGTLEWKKVTSYFEKSITSFFKRQSVLYLFFFILLFKIGDTILNTMTMLFLVDLGFQKIEIAHVAKAFGIISIMIGGFIGGLQLNVRPLRHVLIFVSFLQVFSSLLFMMQAWVGHNLFILFITIGFENLTTGLGTAAFIYFLSDHCFFPYTGTHFAFLTSFGSLTRIGWSSLAGWLADHMSWVYFYGLTAILCAPSLLLLLVSKKKFESQTTKSTAL